MTISLTRQLVKLLQRPVMPKDRQRALSHLLDWVGCAAIGSSSEQGETLRRYLALYGTAASQGSRCCHALGWGSMSWESALRYNAALGNIAEMDDLHRQSVLHPGPVVVPAALACAQLVGASPSQLLDAIVVGYEAAIRVGRAMGADHYALFHNTSTCAGFGAAAAAGRLLGLDETPMVWALGNTGTRTGGLWQLRHEQTMSKQLHTSEAACSGVNAALLASQGFAGPEAILEGPQGIFAAMSPAADASQITAEDPDWLMYDCSFKPWPACRHTHPAIDAALLARAMVPDTSLIDSVLVSSYGDALTFCDRPHPETENAAKFSLQHCVAVVLQEGRPTLQHFFPEILQRADLHGLREKVSVALSDELDAAYRRHWGAHLRIVLVSGEVIEVGTEDALGDPENPMSVADIADKASSLLCAAGMSRPGAQQLSDAVLGLEAEGSLEPLCERLGVRFDEC